MAFPDTPYVTAEHTSVGPLTDPSPYVDLSLLGAEFWALVDTSDGTKGRVFKEDGTRLAVVWLSFNNSAETGGLRFKWSGTWSAAGANIVRIYPPLAARASVASGDAFGSFNAFDDDWKMYLTLDEAVNNDVDGYKDRTSNANHGQGVSMSLPAVTGQVGDAQDFDGGDDRIDVGSDASLDLQVFTMIAWISARDGGARTIIGSSVNSGIQFRVDARGSDNKLELLKQGRALIGTSGVTDDFPDDTLTHAAVTYDVSGNFKIYIDAVLSALGTNAQTFINNSYWVGNRFGGEAFIGLIDEPQIHSTARSADWIAEEVAATKNPGTYWGVWEFIEAGAPPSFDDDVIELTVVMAREQALEVVMAQEQDLEVTMAQEQALTVVI